MMPKRHIHFAMTMILCLLLAACCLVVACGGDETGTTTGGTTTGGATTGETTALDVPADTRAETEEGTIEIDRVSLIGRTGDEYFPYKFRVEVSEDGTNFTTVYEGECPEERDGKQPFDCALDGVKARYVRIVAYSLRDKAGFGDGHLLSLMEVEVYKK